jgi:hypothetical protein
MSTSGRERDKGRQFESGCAKRQKRATVEECKEQSRGSMLKYLRTEKVNLSEDSVENENQDAGNGLTHREDSQSTSVHWEYNNSLMDTSDEVSAKKQQDSVDVNTLKFDDLNATYKSISYDSGEWNFPVEDSGGVNYILKGPIREENLTFPVDDKSRRFSSFHYIRILSNKENQRRCWLVYSLSKSSVFVLSVVYFHP